MIKALILGTAVAFFAIAGASSANPDPGSLDGSFDVGTQGSASYTIPIKCPPGTAGMAPKIALSYNSQAGPGVLGPGWAISGYSIITRGPKNLERDGVVAGAVFDASDALYLDGGRLIPIAANQNDATGSYTEYRMEIDDYSRIRGYGNGAKGHDFFMVWTKAGLILQFGRSADSRPLRADQAPLLWMCGRIDDTLGNYMRFSYELHPGGDYNLKRLEYTGNDKAGVKPYASIEFEYQALKDVPTADGAGLPITTAYVAGEKIFKSFRLTAVKSRYGETLMRHYQMSYKPTSAPPEAAEIPTDSACGFRLDHITEIATDGRRYNPTVFAYTDSLPQDAPAWKVMPDFTLPIDLAAVSDPSAARLGVHYADLNGDKKVDLLYSALVNGKLERATYLSTGTKWDSSASFALPIPLSVAGQSQGGIIIQDINGDGRADVLIHQSGGHKQALINSLLGWKDTPAFVPTTSLGTSSSSHRHFLLLDFDGDGKQDLVWHSSNATLGKGAVRQGAAGWESPARDFTPPIPLDGEGTFSLSIDVNRDGKADLLVFKHRMVPQVYLAGATGWALQPATSPFALSLLSPPHRDGIQLADITGDGHPELLAAYSDSGVDVRETLITSATGWKSMGAVHHSPIPFVTADSISQSVRFADLNGDTKEDILVFTRFLGEGRDERHAFLASATTGWDAASRFLPEFPMAIVPRTASETIELPVFIADISGDRKADLIYQVAVHGETPYVKEKATFLSDGFGWVKADIDYAPPALIAQHEKPDLGIRFVDFNADGLADVLVHYKPKAGAPTQKAMFNTAKGWKDADPKWLFPYPTAEEEGSNTGITFIDVNGDARVDALVRRKSEDGKSETIHAYINDPIDPNVGWKDTPAWHPPIALSQDKRGDLGARFLDLNGDGLTDILASIQDLDGNIANRAWVNTGSGWQETPSFAALPAGVALVHEFRPIGPEKTFQDVYRWDWEAWKTHPIYRDVGVLITDLNGDRLPDIAFYHEFLQSEAKTAQDYPAPNPKDPPLKPGDRPGIGQWRLSIKHNPLVSGALINTGGGWRNAPEYTPPRRLDTPWGAKSHYYEPQDVNLDGLTDLVYIEYGKDKINRSASYMNTGRGWEPNPAAEWRVPDAAFVADAITTDGKGDHGIRLMDINGDGMLDILQSFRIDDGNIPAQAWLSNGMTWISRPNYISKVENNTILAMADKTGDDTGVRPVDVNGDLIPDLIAWKKYADGHELRSAYLNQSKRRDILLTVTNGMGFKIQFDHRTMTLWHEARPNATPDNAATNESPAMDKTIGDFYTPTSKPGSYPILPAPPPIHAIETVRLWEPDESGQPIRLRQSLRYHYGEFRVNSKSGIPLGFGWRTVINESTGMMEWSRFEQTRSPYLVGTTLESKVSYNKNFLPATEENPCPGALQSHSATEWADPRLIDCLLNPAGRPYKRVQIFIQKTFSHIHDLDGTRLGSQEDSFEYDDFGNATVVKNRRFNANNTPEGTGSTITSKFDNDTEKWYLGRLSRSSATLFNTREGSSQTRTASFGYNSDTGLLNRETTFVGHPKVLTITYEHDAFGNKIATSTAAQGIPTRRASMKFDPIGRFPVETSNALGHTSRASYEPAFGNVLNATDPNGVTAASEYDSHGALTKQISPTGVAAISSCEFLTEPVIVGEKKRSRAIFRTVAQVGTLPKSEILLDCQGRTLRSITLGEGGKRIFQDTEYDDFKRPFRSSIPYFEGTNPANIYWTQTEYENGTDRPLSITTPDGGTTRFAYRGLTTIVTDKLGRQTRTEYNLRKLPIRVTDPMRGVLRYSYDVGDRLTKIINADGTVTRYTYDALGQRTDTYDPDLGHWQYRYNALGELTWQKDAKGQATTIKYDILGRPVVKEEADRWTIWKYDSAAHGLGKLASIEGSDGYSESYAFDRVGRTSETVITALGEKFTTQTEYDAYNRTVGITYPTGFQVHHTFDALGFMRSVSGVKTGVTYWQGIRYNEFGQVVEESLGNGVTSTHGYSRKTGFLESIAAVDSRGTSVQDLRYTYNLAGNVTTRRDAAQHSQETFTYDALDRLTSASVNGRISQSIRYGLTGNILHKSDVGRYTYGDGGKKGPAHAVTAVTNAAGSVQAYAYDANGNLTSSPSVKHASYTAANLTASLIGERGVWSDFKYSPSGSKYWQEMRDGPAWIRTLYLGLYERIREEMVPYWEPTNERLRHRHYIAAPSGVCAIVEDITEFFPVRHSPRLHTLSLLGGDKNERTTRQVSSTVYLHADALGSISAISDIAGNVSERLRFDPWGKRVEPPTEKNKDTYYTYKNGFTGHEHLDNLGLVHMGGRVFDPSLALFTRADPVTQTLALTNAFNRFAYALNNPLRFTDPTGYSWFSRAISGIGKAFGKIGGWLDRNIWQPVGKFFEKNWKQIVVTVVVVAVVVLVTYASFGTLTVPATATAAQILGYGIAAGAAAGAAGAMTASALDGRNLGEVISAGIQGAAMGAATGMLMGGAGALTQGLNPFVQAAAFGVAGGLGTEMQGGDFWLGFAAGASGALTGRYVRGFHGETTVRVGSAAVVGGTISKLGGGKFANGAAMAGFASLLSETTAQLDSQDEVKKLSDDVKTDRKRPSRESYRLARSANSSKQLRDENRMHPATQSNWDNICDSTQEILFQEFGSTVGISDGYFDINISGGNKLGANAGMFVAPEGCYLYGGGCATTPGVGGAITYSSSSVTANSWGVQLQGSAYGASAALGYTFSGPISSKNVFTEGGIGGPMGANLCIYRTGARFGNPIRK